MVNKYNKNSLLKEEINDFKNTWAKDIDFKDVKNKKEVEKALLKSLDATLNRHKECDHKDFAQKFVQPFITKYIKFATSKNRKKDFDKYFSYLTNTYIKDMTKENKNAAEFGYAQKFVSLSFKLIYCFDNSNKANFKDCKMIIDNYILNWVNSFKDNEYSSVVWSKMEKETYKKIQEDIFRKLKDKNYNYQVVCWDKNETIKLSDVAIESEFVIWTQEKLNEIYLSMEKNPNKNRIVKKLK